MSLKTASAILRGTWLIDINWANNHLPLVASVLKGQGSFAGLYDDEEKEEKAKEAQRVATKAGVVYKVGYYTDLSRLPEGSIAMISLTGPLLKYGDGCSYGMVDKAPMIQRAANAPNIKGIILDIDSPGGQAYGTSMLADMIKAIQKPTIGMIDDGIAASAAMWVASATDEIYVTKKTDQVGSVGVYTTLYDWKTYFEKEGLPVHEIYAPQSKDKNGDYREALKGNYEQLQEELKVLADAFIGTIETNRSGKIKGDEWKTGKMFYAKDAERIGLIDGIKSFDQVVRRMDQMIATKSENSNRNKMAFQKTLSAAKAEQFEVVDGGFLLSEENLNNIEATFAAQDAETVQNLNNQLSEANTARETAEASLATANQTIADRDVRIAALEAENEKLSKQPAGEFHATSKEKDEQPGDKKEAYHLSESNPFNQFADSIMGRPKS